MLDNLRREMVDSANAPSYRLIYALNEHGFWRYLNDEIPIPGAPMPATMTPAYVPTPGVIPLTTAELTPLPAAQPVEQIVSLPQPLSLGQQSAATPY